MFEARNHETTFEHSLRVVARATDIICVAIIILFVLGQDFVFGYMSAKEWAGFLFFPIGVFVGLTVAWREELIGGAVIVGSVACFYFVYGWLLNSSVWLGWGFLPFLLAGFVFMVYGVLRIRRHPAMAG